MWPNANTEVPVEDLGNTEVPRRALLLLASRATRQDSRHEVKHARLFFRARYCLPV
jgi:hypothetical protein